MARVDAAETWGYAIEALVLSSPNEVNDIMHLMSCTIPIYVALVLTAHLKKDWGGLLVLTIHAAVDAQLAVRIFDC